MKIKKLKVMDDVIHNVLVGAIILSPIAFSVGFYTYEKQTQVVESNISNEDTFIDENGDVCCYFDVGEHKIIISRNDVYYRNIESIDGYEIKNVEVNGWRDNNKTTYVNNMPVIAKATVNKNGKISFDNFGTIVEKEKIYNK